MRWAPLHPRQLLTIGLLAFALALMLALAAAPDVGTLDFSIGSGGDAASPASPTPAPDPAWTQDPLAPPVDVLRGG